MVANPDKFQLILPMYVGNDLFVTVNSVKIFNLDFVKLLGVYLDSKLNFRVNVGEICKKISQKTKALARIRHCRSPF